MKEKWKLTVEPAGFILLLGSYIASTASKTLRIEKTCRVNLQLPEAICDALRNQDTDANADNERIVQEYVARLIAYNSIITSVLPCTLLIFAGGWMDVTGRRKIIITLAVVGKVLVQISNILNVVFFDELVVEYLIFFDGLFGSIFGGEIILFLALYSYIADITTEENRTFRLGVLHYVAYSGMTVGVLLSGYLLNNYEYLIVYIISLCLVATTTAYLAFVLKDPTRTEEQRKHDNRGFIYFLKTFFDPAHLLSSMRVLFRKTANSRAIQLCLLVIASVFLFGPASGEDAVVYMYTRFKFAWDEVQYAVFQTYDNLVGAGGTAAAFFIVSGYLGWNDAVLGMLSAVSKICSSFVYCFAPNEDIFYKGLIANMFQHAGVMAIRSTLTKLVESNEVAKINSIIGIVEVLAPLAFVPAYTVIYTSTMGWLPGFFYLIATVLTVPVFFIFVWLLIRHLRQSKAVVVPAVDLGQTSQPAVENSSDFLHL